MMKGTVAQLPDGALITLLVGRNGFLNLSGIDARLSGVGLSCVMCLSHSCLKGGS